MSEVMPGLFKIARIGKMLEGADEQTLQACEADQNHLVRQAARNERTRRKLFPASSSERV